MQDNLELPMKICFSGYQLWLEDKRIFYFLIVFSDPTCDGDHLEQNVLFFQSNMATPTGVSLSLQRPWFFQTSWSFLFMWL